MTDATIARRRSTEIKRHGPEAFAAMRKAGRLVAEGLDMIAAHVRPGVTTAAIDRLLFEFAMDHKSFPATLNYRGYRHSCCTSINHVVCHGQPEDKPLREGDIVNIDYTLIVDGWHGDSSRMYAVGAINRKAERLCEITHEALLRGVAAVRPAATPATSATRSRPTPRPSAAPSCATSAATGSARCSTTRRTSCTTARAGRGPGWSPACSSPSSR